MYIARPWGQSGGARARASYPLHPHQNIPDFNPSDALFMHKLYVSEDAVYIYIYIHNISIYLQHISISIYLYVYIYIYTLCMCA